MEIWEEGQMVEAWSQLLQWIQTREKTFWRDLEGGEKDWFRGRRGEEEQIQESNLVSELGAWDRIGYLPFPVAWGPQRSCKADCTDGGIEFEDLSESQMGDNLKGVMYKSKTQKKELGQGQGFGVHQDLRGDKLMGLNEE